MRKLQVPEGTVDYKADFSHSDILISYSGAQVRSNFTSFTQVP